MSESDGCVDSRRALLEKLGCDFDKETIPPGSMGIALSGGGIRSATISLGFIQSLARRRRLLDFDYLSTVSGGGYIGSFLRSLFVPQSDRGVDGSGGKTLTSEDTLEFVKYVLCQDAKKERIVSPFPGGGEIRNPIWWLREHGRYLAPNGATDYISATTYIIRNWLAMIFTFAVPAATSFVVLIVPQILLIEFFPRFAKELVFGTSPKVGELADLASSTCNSIFKSSTEACYPVFLSPLYIICAFMGIIFLATCAAYWTTVSLQLGNAWRYRKLLGGGRNRCIVSRPGRNTVVSQFWTQILINALMTGIISTVTFLIWSNRGNKAGSAVVAQWWPLFAGLLLSVMALLIASVSAFKVFREQNTDIFASELRRQITAYSTCLAKLLVMLLALATIDTATIWLGPALLRLFKSSGYFGIIAAAIPGAAWLIAKLPQWFGDTKITKWIGLHIWTVALIIGVILFATVALAADLLVRAIILAFPLDLNRPILDTWCAVGFLALILGVVTFWTGSFSGFINLSSLHSLYAGRLTRAYLGASNVNRLTEAAKLGCSPITENHPDDYIDISAYQRTPSAAPIHLINVTLNETENAERLQLIDRDRKGVPLVFVPDGVIVDGARQGNTTAKNFYPWRKLKLMGVEPLSVGQLCAISGAAASSGMGMRTTLGGALAFTFANIRLGYWWRVKELFVPSEQRKARGRRISKILGRSFQTYRYLLNEMLANYSRRDSRVYLSDGGHFENSGVYELLRRNVSLIVCCDNGADPLFVFEDLENLTRKARVDLGLAIVQASQQNVRKVFGAAGADLFFNGANDDWRAVAKSVGGSQCAVLLEVYKTDKSEDKSSGYRKSDRVGFIIWMKPRAFDLMPIDAAGYHERNPAFPQQSTANQFFDEAQWESYRVLGYSMAEVMMLLTDGKIDVFRRLVDASFLERIDADSEVMRRNKTYPKPPFRSAAL